MAGSPGTDEYNAAGNSDFSRKAVELWTTPCTDDTATRSKPYAQGGTALSMQADQWPTPRTITGGAESAQRKKELGRTEAGGGDLQAATLQWMTPNVPNGGRSASHAEMKGRTAYHAGKKVQVGLEHQVRQWPMGQDWPTPNVWDAESNGTSHRKATIEAGGRGSRHGISLHHEVAQWPTPMTRDHRSGHSQKSDEELWGTKGKPLERVATSFHPSHQDPPTPDGPLSSPSRLRLNPLFVEWMMGWPTGLSGFARAETELSRWLLQMRGCLSTLASQPPAQPTLL
jgi:hypothetical protein